MLTYLKFPLLSLFLGLALAGILSWTRNHEFTLVLQTFLTVSLLSILEISLSFDNAVVNATVIKKMNAVWKKRFLFWGMLIAVFGMRFIFPIIIVSISGKLSLLDSLNLAFQKPDQYAQIMQEAHLAVSSFGGAFLLMVGLHFFLNSEKNHHWIWWIEKPLVYLARIKNSEVILSLFILILINLNVNPSQRSSFMESSLYGVLTYLSVHGLSEILGDEKLTLVKGLSSGLGLFLYLEVLDASFSFDGVIGAFAITKQIYEIIIGLGIGAFFVRGLTLYLVDNHKLEQYKFLEHGAFYALLALAFFMLLDYFYHFSEWVTGLTGAIILLLSILWSVYIDRKA